MPQDDAPKPAFVVKVEELSALNYLSADHQRPQLVEWINRGTDQKLKASTIDMLMRTLYQDQSSESVARLHQSSGLRAIFRTEQERNEFARAFAAARDLEFVSSQDLVTAIFDDREDTELAVSQLKNAGVADRSISLLWRASQFMDTDIKWVEGHSKLSVASVAAGSGIAGAMLGIAVLSIPGVGPVAAAGALAASVFGSVAAVSGVIGATGGTIAKMLTDHDVDGVSATYYAQLVQRGKIFLSVDTRIAGVKGEEVREILSQNNGRFAPGR